MAMTSLLTDVGFSWSLLRKTELSDADVQFALTVQVTFGVLLGVLLYATSDFLARHMAGEPVGWVIRLLAFSVVFNAAASTPSILLSRDLSYGHLGKGQLLSYIAGYFFTGVPMALAGYGTIALVSAFLVQSIVRCGLMFFFSRLRWIPTFKHEFYRSFMGEGLLVFATNMVNWLVYNVDRLIVSKIMPSQALGIYNVSANLAGTPNAVLLGSIQPVFLATGARLQNDGALRSAYLGVLRAALLIAPAFYGTLAMNAESLVHILYGSRWADASSVIAILFLGMPFFVIWSVSTPILWNTGKPYQEAFFQLPIIIFAALTCYFASFIGLAALAIAADIVLFLRAVAMFMAASRRVLLDWRDLVSVLWIGLAFLAITFCSGFVMGQIDTPDIVKLISSSVLTALACLALLRFLPYRLSRDSINTVGSISIKVSSMLRAKRCHNS